MHPLTKYGEIASLDLMMHYMQIHIEIRYIKLATDHRPKVASYNYAGY